jgi:hypothetical protein
MRIHSTAVDAPQKSMAIQQFDVFSKASMRRTSSTSRFERPPVTWLVRLIVTRFQTSSLLTDDTDRIGFSKVSLVWGHVLDAAMPMLAVVPLHKAFHPTAHGSWSRPPRCQKQPEIVKVNYPRLRNNNRSKCSISGSRGCPMTPP